MAYLEKAFEEFFKSAIRAEGDGTLYLSNSDNKIRRKYSCFRWIFYPSSPDDRVERFFFPSATWKSSFPSQLVKES